MYYRRVFPFIHFAKEVHHELSSTVYPLRVVSSGIISCSPGIARATARQIQKIR